MTASATAPPTSLRPELTALVARLRSVLDATRAEEAATADLVAAELRARTPTAEVLTPAQREGDADRPTSRILFAEERFSVVALAWRPGQETTIHDHLAWCVVTVLCGTEQETVFRDAGDHLVPVAHSVNAAGSVSALVPPGDIHRVANDTATTAVSLHIYGTDLRIPGSSIRRTYDLPVRGQ